jgi:SAM-dependent methyltransferase
MSDWTDGYVADIGYTFGYYPELNPLRIQLAFINQGLVCPEVGAACELGFGQGMSVNMHAAATVTQWAGTDFNPSQADFAQELAGASGSTVRLMDDSFEEFAARQDLPDFDFIGLHGIWSWISDANRKVIVDFMRRKLKVGGVLYISYNTQPGWAAMVPMRDLLAEHAKVMGAEGSGIVKRIDSAMEFAEKLFATQPAFLQVNSSVSQRFERIKAQSRNYLAHEYFNQDWLPMSFAKMHEWLAPAKLDFACSAHYTDHIHAVNLSPDQQKMLNEIPDLTFRETVRDFMVNQQFRRDYWVKGRRLLGSVERTDALRKVRILLVRDPADIPLELNGTYGKATLQENVYKPLLAFLVDHKPHRLGEIEQALMGKVDLSKLLHASIVLVGQGFLVHVQEDDAIKLVQPACDQLNQYLMRKTNGGAEMSYLVSPMTGGGINVSRFEQLFLLAKTQGLDSNEWAKFAWKSLSALGQKLIKDGELVKTDQENLEMLTANAKDFAGKRLQILQSLRIA